MLRRGVPPGVWRDRPVWGHSEDSESFSLTVEKSPNYTRTLASQTLSEKWFVMPFFRATSPLVAFLGFGDTR